MQRPCLIVHQRMHRRNHHRDAQPDALAGQRRHLATLALAATGGHLRQRFATDDHLFDDHLFDDVR